MHRVAALGPILIGQITKVSFSPSGCHKFAIKHLYSILRGRSTVPSAGQMPPRVAVQTLWSSGVGEGQAQGGTSLGGSLSSMSGCKP